MSLPNNLAERIDDTRIEYPQHETGYSITGAPFVVEFESPIDPESLCNTVTTAEEPWYMFGITSKINDNDYWKVVGTLFHVKENGDVVDATKISFEVAPEWMRVYAKGEADEHRIAAFVETLNEEYPIDYVSFSDTTTEE